MKFWRQMMVNEKLLSPTVASAFYGNFKSLHDIQDSAIKPIVEGKNVVLSASTGSGKTEAVMAPLVSRYIKNTIQNNSLTILYIAPTKALVNDLERRLSPSLNKLGLRLGVRHGDRDDMKSKHVPNVLITTPESLDVMLFRGDESLNDVHAIIIDEAHLLYNTQRGLHLSILLNRLRNILNHSLQWAAISATMANLRHIRDFFFGSQEEAEFLKDSTSREIDAQIRFLQSPDDLHILFNRLIKANNGKGKFLIFANSRNECEYIAECLVSDESLKPFVFTHYSSLSTEMRNDVESSFGQSMCAICIATNTLELGIDIGNIDAVFMYGPPSGIESFLQRIGRSNRRSKKTNVVCFIRLYSSNPFLEALEFHALIHFAKQGLLPQRQPYELFGAAVQQALSYIGSVEGKFIRTAELAQMCEHLPHLDRLALESIFECMSEQEYLLPHGFKNQYGAGQNLYKLIDYRMIYGNFPVSSQKIPIFYKSKILGYVPSINLLRIHNGSNIRFAGKKWQVKKAKIEAIEVTISHNSDDIVNMIYLGSGMGIDSFVLNAVLEIIYHDELEFELYAKDDREMMQSLFVSIRKSMKENTIPYFKSHDKYVYLTFAGSLINKAIALITKQYDFKANDTTLICSTKINWNNIPTNPNDYELVFDDLFEANSNQTFYQSLLPEIFQKREYLQNWLRDSMNSMHLQRLRNSLAIELNHELMSAWGIIQIGD